MTDLITWLRTQLDTDEQWARAASQPYRFADEGSTAPADGVHWQWVAGEDWDPVRPDPVTMEFLEGPDGSWAANLATVEEWRVTNELGSGRTYERMTVRTYADSIDEMDPAAAGHIIRHDPARVLRQVQAHRAILDLHEQTEYGDLARLSALEDAIQHLASIYSDRDGYDPDWSA